MNKSIAFALLALLFIACDVSDDFNENTNDNPQEDEILSVKGKMEFLGIAQLEEGPHDLLIVNQFLYAGRDNKLYKFDVSNPLNLALVGEYTALKKLGRITAYANGVLVPGKDDGKLHQFDENFNLVKSYDYNLNDFKGSDILVDGVHLWIAGSIGANGTLAKYTFTAQGLDLIDSWRTAFGESNMESIVEKDRYLLVSLANGDLLVFDKETFASGPTHSLEFDNEPGHGKWGKTILTHKNQAFWANWGAGLLTIDISDMRNPSISYILTHSKFKDQFPDASGTNVYDIDYNDKHSVLCIANGWGGLFLVNPDAPDVVLDDISPEYLQNYSVATTGDYIFTGNISGGMSGDLKGIAVYRLRE